LEGLFQHRELVWSLMELALVLCLRLQETVAMQHPGLEPHPRAMNQEQQPEYHFRKILHHQRRLGEMLEMLGLLNPGMNFQLSLVVQQSLEQRYLG
jgi:hypothetical protein